MDLMDILMSLLNADHYLLLYITFLITAVTLKEQLQASAW